ncbi:MAG: hypothetical protein KDK02_00700 [Rhodobacteraceae bacterium]|nr:hypothetical protein [Paracoccaceae bacterium]
MKPNFALSLSFDGIALLHRAAGGWRHVATVATDAPDLSRQLEGMREKALRLEPDGLRCKLIIPNDQIRYMTVKTGTLGGDARRDAVRAALAGATPYALDELAFDIAVDGAQTHVAAVARETLAEAEAFASEHGFHPICFVAVPGDEPFLGEPFFGASDHAASLPGGERVEAEGIAVVVVGDAVFPDARSETPVAAGADAPDPDKAHPEPGENAKRTESEAAGEAESAAAITPMPNEADGPAPQVAGFSSRRSAPDAAAPGLGGALREAALPEPARRLTIVADATDAEAATPPKRVSVNAPDLAIPDPGPPARAAAPAKARRGFFSRRTAAKPGPAAPRAPNAASPRIDDLPASDETARMTRFGARGVAAVGGKPRHLGLILTLALLVFLAAIAAWAALFLDNGIAGLFRQTETKSDFALVPAPRQPAAPRPPESTAALRGADLPAPKSVPLHTPAPAPDGDGATPPAGDAAEPTLSDTDSAALDALRESARDETPETAAQPGLQDRALYAATGIWSGAPEVPRTPAIIGLDDLYVASIDRTDLSQDAVALPAPAALDTDHSLASRTSPAAADAVFDIGADGLVVPTAAGTVSPEGITVYLGRPPVVPPPTPARTDPAPELDAIRDRLAQLRPRPRPGNLIERNERAQLGGLSRDELGGVRPRLRPENAKTEAEEDETPTAQAIAASRAPRARPGDFTRIVAQAARQPAPSSAEAEAEADGEPETRTAAAAPATVAPRIPSSASVSRQATLNNAINLKKVNLIGVYGTPSNRRALVRLPSGRYKKVKVGDHVDGGRIVAIGESELRYQKGGRNMTLKMPKG